jgi:hypothetical protein
MASNVPPFFDECVANEVGLRPSATISSFHAFLIVDDATLQAGAALNPPPDCVNWQAKKDLSSPSVIPITRRDGRRRRKLDPKWRTRPSPLNRLRTLTLLLLDPGSFGQVIPRDLGSPDVSGHH